MWTKVHHTFVPCYSNYIRLDADLAHSLLHPEVEVTIHSPTSKRIHCRYTSSESDKTNYTLATDAPLNKLLRITEYLYYTILFYYYYKTCKNWQKSHVKKFRNEFEGMTSNMIRSNEYTHRYNTFTLR